MISIEDEEKAIQRVELAVKALQEAFSKLNKHFRSSGSCGANGDELDTFEAADVEYRSAKSEMDTITEQIRNGMRK